MPLFRGPWYHLQADLPVYQMRYSTETITKDIRVEWNHVPQNPDDVADIMAVLRAYMDNPYDKAYNDEGLKFTTFLPDYCVVLYVLLFFLSRSRLPLVLYDSEENSHQFLPSDPDERWDRKDHLTVRFTTAEGRNIERGISVQIYICPNTKRYDPEKPVVWFDNTPDKRNQKGSWSERSTWPPGADADNAPWYPGEEPQA